MHWYWVALGYVSYLALVSLGHEFARARRRLMTAAAVAWLAQAAVSANPYPQRVLGPLTQLVLPSLVLVLGYWLSGLLLVRVDRRIEEWLHAIDERVLIRTGILDRYRRGPRAVREYFEFSYLLVYPVVPAGAATLAITGHADQIGAYWTVVLLAAFSCYAVLPWVQTRPPRVLEATAEQDRGDMLRRVSLGLTAQASIKANTVPSGHAATAVAAALAVWSVVPAPGVVLLVLAASIGIATVLGRYHYLVDTVLGILVALVIWMLVDPTSNPLHH